MNIQPTKPFLVHYPHGGNMLLLHWWTYNERGHVALASSERVMHETASRIFSENPDAEIKDYIEIEVVAPPQRFCELAAQYDYQESVRSFRIEIVCGLREALDKGRSLPDQFKKCLNYEDADPDPDPDPDSDFFEDQNWKIKNHYNCKNCNDGIILGSSPEDLYEKYGKRWNELKTSKYAHKKSNRNVRIPSRARQVIDSEGLWCAIANFGHHSSGIDLVETDREGTSEVIDGFGSYLCRPRYLSDNCLFFYLKLAEIDKTKLQTILETAKAHSLEKKARADEVWKNRRITEAENRINKVLDLFCK